MAVIKHIMQTLALRLTSLLDYNGQKPLDSYYAKLKAINETAHPLQF